MNFIYIKNMIFFFVYSPWGIFVKKYVFRPLIFCFFVVVVWSLNAEIIFQPRLEVGGNNFTDKEKLDIIKNFFSVNSRQFKQEPLALQYSVLMVVMDWINCIQSIPYSSVRGHLYFQNEDAYIEYYMNKSTFWDVQGKNFSSEQKEIIFKQSKNYIKLLITESQYSDNVNFLKIIHYKNKIQILFKEVGFPPSDPSSYIPKRLPSAEPYKPGEGGEGAWIRRRLAYREECIRERIRKNS